MSIQSTTNLYAPMLRRVGSTVLMLGVIAGTGCSMTQKDKPVESYGVIETKTTAYFVPNLSIYKLDKYWSATPKEKKEMLKGLKHEPIAKYNEEQKESKRYEMQQTEIRADHQMIRNSIESLHDQ